MGEGEYVDSTPRTTELVRKTGRHLLLTSRRETRAAPSFAAILIRAAARRVPSNCIVARYIGELQALHHVL